MPLHQLLHHHLDASLLRLRQVLQVHLFVGVRVGEGHGGDLVAEVVIQGNGKLTLAHGAGVGVVHPVKGVGTAAAHQGLIQLGLCQIHTAHAAAAVHGEFQFLTVGGRPGGLDRDVCHRGVGPGCLRVVEDLHSLAQIVPALPERGLLPFQGLVHVQLHLIADAELSASVDLAAVRPLQHHLEEGAGLFGGIALRRVGQKDRILPRVCEGAVPVNSLRESAVLPDSDGHIVLQVQIPHQRLDILAAFKGTVLYGDNGIPGVPPHIHKAGDEILRLHIAGGRQAVDHAEGIAAGVGVLPRALGDNMGRLFDGQQRGHPLGYRGAGRGLPRPVPHTAAGGVAQGQVVEGGEGRVLRLTLVHGIQQFPVVHLRDIGHRGNAAAAVGAGVVQALELHHQGLAEAAVVDLGAHAQGGHGLTQGAADTVRHIARVINVDRQGVCLCVGAIAAENGPVDARLCGVPEGIVSFLVLAGVLPLAVHIPLPGAVAIVAAVLGAVGNGDRPEAAAVAQLADAEAAAFAAVAEHPGDMGIGPWLDGQFRAADVLSRGGAHAVGNGQQAVIPAVIVCRGVDNRTVRADRVCVQHRLHGPIDHGLAAVALRRAAVLVQLGHIGPGGGGDADGHLIKAAVGGGGGPAVSAAAHKPGDITGAGREFRRAAVITLGITVYIGHPCHLGKKADGDVLGAGVPVLGHAGIAVGEIDGPLIVGIVGQTAAVAGQIAVLHQLVDAAAAGVAVAAHAAGTALRHVQLRPLLAAVGIAHVDLAHVHLLTLQQGISAAAVDEGRQAPVHLGIDRAHVPAGPIRCVKGHGPEDGVLADPLSVHIAVLIAGNAASGCSAPAGRAALTGGNAHLEPVCHRAVIAAVVRIIRQESAQAPEHRGVEAGTGGIEHMDAPAGGLGRQVIAAPAAAVVFHLLIPVVVFVPLRDLVGMWVDDEVDILAVAVGAAGAVDHQLAAAAVITAAEHLFQLVLKLDVISAILAEAAAVCHQVFVPLHLGHRDRSRKLPFTIAEVAHHAADPGPAVIGAEGCLLSVGGDQLVPAQEGAVGKVIVGVGGVGHVGLEVRPVVVAPVAAGIGLEIRVNRLRQESVAAGGTLGRVGCAGLAQIVIAYIDIGRTVTGAAVNGHIQPLRLVRRVQPGCSLVRNIAGTLVIVIGNGGHIQLEGRNMLGKTVRTIGDLRMDGVGDVAVSAIVLGTGARHRIFPPEGHIHLQMLFFTGEPHGGHAVAVLNNVIFRGADPVVQQLAVLILRGVGHTQGKTGAVSIPIAIEDGKVILAHPHAHGVLGGDGQVPIGQFHALFILVAGNLDIPVIGSGAAGAAAQIQGIPLSLRHRRNFRRHLEPEGAAGHGLQLIGLPGGQGVADIGAVTEHAGDINTVGYILEEYLHDIGTVLSVNAAVGGHIAGGLEKCRRLFRIQHLIAVPVLFGGDQFLGQLVQEVGHVFLDAALPVVGQDLRHADVDVHTGAPGHRAAVFIVGILLFIGIVGVDDPLPPIVESGVDLQLALLVPAGNGLEGCCGRREGQLRLLRRFRFLRCFWLLGILRFSTGFFSIFRVLFRVFRFLITGLRIGILIPIRRLVFRGIGRVLPLCFAFGSIRDTALCLFRFFGGRLCAAFRKGSRRYNAENQNQAQQCCKHTSLHGFLPFFTVS